MKIGPVTQLNDQNFINGVVGLLGHILLGCVHKCFILVGTCYEKCELQQGIKLE